MSSSWRDKPQTVKELHERINARAGIAPPEPRDNMTLPPGFEAGVTFAAGAVSSKVPGEAGPIRWFDHPLDEQERAALQAAPDWGVSSVDVVERNSVDRLVAELRLLGWRLEWWWMDRVADARRLVRWR